MKLEHVSFSYGEKVIFHDFSLALPDTGVTALSGPSGCGKTTLLRLLAGLEKPDSGRIDAPGPAGTTILFQEDRLLPGLTAAAQLRAVLGRGVDAEGLLRAVGLEGEGGTGTRQLSGGMRRRVALARALGRAGRSRLVLLDEPFTGVDPPTARRIMDAFRGLGIPVILTAHDDHSLSLADKRIPVK